MSASAPKSRRIPLLGGCLLLLLLPALAACVSHAPRLQNGNFGVVAGKETAGLDDKAATDKVLVEAARLTVDHGYRYFTLVPGGKASGTAPRDLIHAGQNVQFQILRRARPGRGVWDAYRLLTRGG